MIEYNIASQFSQECWISNPLMVKWLGTYLGQVPEQV